jgi:photosystem I P700 chlorophyll a apoprotein A2
MFLFGHLVWATGFMFLISWRGYWQELIETLAWRRRCVSDSSFGSTEEKTLPMKNNNWLHTLSFLNFASYFFPRLIRNLTA